MKKWFTRLGLATALLATVSGAQAQQELVVDGTKGYDSMAGTGLVAGQDYVLPGTDAMIQGFSFWQPNEDGVFQMLEEIYRIGSGEEGDLSIPTTIRLLEKPTLNRNYLPKGDGTVIDIEFDSQGNVVTDPEPVEGSGEGSETSE